MEKKRFAFVLRIWDENTAVTGQDELEELRGSIQLVESEKVVYFGYLDDIPKLLRRAIRERGQQES